MDLMEAIQQRHSVRAYENRPISQDIKENLKRKILELNLESGLHIQLVSDEPKAFNGMMARYGNFTDVTNYIAMIGKKGSDLEEKCGYYGEQLVLFAQQLGLNTCWVALTYSRVKRVYQIGVGEKLVLIIAIGYGKTQGVPRKSKVASDVSKAPSDAPEWFHKGVEAALLAPTAVNQQKFILTLNGMNVEAKARLGPYSKVDLGIVKYHFEIGAGTDNFTWV